jgi:hypothetical protein
VLQIEGPLQNVDDVIHVQAKHLEAVPLAGPDLPGSHDYF